MKPGLLRIKNFLKSTGNPQDKFKSIHIAGTNGKGSVSNFVSEILQSAGYKTAFYCSPHLIDITERIKINGQNIGKKVFFNYSKKYLQKAAEYKLSYFEYLTAIAFTYFADLKVDVAVVETGLGGRFDATNIIKNPLVCVITSIAKDHQEILGKSIKEIAFEKAGIIKKKSLVVCGDLSGAACKIIKSKSKDVCFFNRNFKAENIESGICGQKFDYISQEADIKDIKIKMLGRHQIINASVAVCVSFGLNKKGFLIREDDIKHGLASAFWAGRFEIREIKSKKVKLILDGAHNTEGLNVFIETFKKMHFAKSKKTFIFSVMKEKNYKAMAKLIASFAKKIILPHIGNIRAVDTEILKNEFSKHIAADRIVTVETVKEIFENLKTPETAFAVGSLYLVGEILKNIKN
ncbi:MAG: bifunctional folylpolyglutamate synthase/dihydrofolate synthase [Elusimicrobiota bacterium]|nr:bifunctional folylpolyglutamate synthase/dihydrofolate synthase [Elusimicrobiota bacterium]